MIVKTDRFIFRGHSKIILFPLADFSFIMAKLSTDVRKAYSAVLLEVFSFAEQTTAQTVYNRPPEKVFIDIFSDRGGRFVFQPRLYPGGCRSVFAGLASRSQRIRLFDAYGRCPVRSLFVLRHSGMDAAFSRCNCNKQNGLAIDFARLHRFCFCDDLPAVLEHGHRLVYIRRLRLRECSSSCQVLPSGLSCHACSLTGGRFAF